MDCSQPRFATFECHGGLHVTNLERITIELTAMRGTWHARMSGARAWMAVAEDYEASPLDPRDARTLIQTPGDGDLCEMLAVLDRGAVDEPEVEAYLRGFEGNDVCGRGAATFEQAPRLVTVWERAGRCVAVRVTTAAFGDDDAHPDAGHLLPFPHRGHHVFGFDHGVTVIDDVLVDRARGVVVVAHTLADDTQLTLTDAQAAARFRPLIKSNEAQAIVDALERGAIALDQYPAPYPALAQTYAQPSPPSDEEFEALEALEHHAFGELVLILDRSDDLAPWIESARAAYPRFR